MFIWWQNNDMIQPTAEFTHTGEGYFNEKNTLSIKLSQLLDFYIVYNCYTACVYNTV